MTVKRVKCREHDGWFKVVVKPGRPPVRCTEENRCDKAEQISKLAKATGLRESQIVIGRPDAKPTRKQLAAERDALEAADKAQRAAAKAPVIKSEPRSPRNRSVPLAMACKAELEALGWTVKGRGWIEEPGDPELPTTLEMAEVTAVRGSESLVITWNDGTAYRQDYNLWHSRRSLNGAPARKLKFNPDEMTDRELVRAIAGMRVTWWNMLGKSEESYAVGDRISIEHFYADNGDEDTGRRIVKFIDRNGRGYRHFHVDALLKVG